jgi:hypothetical protein
VQRAIVKFPFEEVNLKEETSINALGALKTLS